MDPSLAMVNVAMQRLQADLKHAFGSNGLTELESWALAFILTTAGTAFAAASAKKLGPVTGPAASPMCQFCVPEGCSWVKKPAFELL